jgi:hypothetical protein
MMICSSYVAPAIPAEAVPLGLNADHLLRSEWPAETKDQPGVQPDLLDQMAFVSDQVVDVEEGKAGGPPASSTRCFGVPPRSG